MLRPGLFGSLHEYGMRYCDGRPADFPGPGVVGGYDFRCAGGAGGKEGLVLRALVCGTGCEAAWLRGRLAARP